MGGYNHLNCSLRSLDGSEFGFYGIPKGSMELE
jgi:hypothetical protein